MSYRNCRRGSYSETRTPNPIRQLAFCILAGAPPPSEFVSFAAKATATVLPPSDGVGLLLVVRLSPYHHPFLLRPRLVRPISVRSPAPEPIPKHRDQPVSLPLDSRLGLSQPYGVACAGPVRALSGRCLLSHTRERAWASRQGKAMRLARQHAGSGPTPNLQATRFCSRRHSASRRVRLLPCFLPPKSEATALCPTATLFATPSQPNPFSTR